MTAQASEAPKRPALRYHGGKWMLAPWIISHLPAHRVYTEVYGGAASVLLRKPRSHAEVYNDLDGQVVNLFRVLQNMDSYNELIRLCSLTPFAREEFRVAYEPTDDPVERARRLIVRSFMGFGSDSATSHRTGFRANSNRSGTTPAHDWANYPTALTAIIERFQSVIIENREATDVLLQHDAPATLHYVDPPYVHDTRVRGRRKNYRFKMSDNDHRALAEVLRGLQGMVVLSGYPSELYGELFGDWKSVSRPALADGALPRTEMLWLNPAAMVAQQDGDLFGGRG